DFYRDLFWTGQRTAIVSLFLFCAGAGQGLAEAAGLGWAHFFSRWWRVLACALLVSAGSWWMFPRSWISFGVLHGMAVMLLLVRLLAGWRLPLALVLLLSAVCLLLPWSGGHAFFDSRWTNWVGLVTHKPITEDYVPLLPWLGAMLIGSQAGLAWARRAGPGLGVGARLADRGGPAGPLAPFSSLTPILRGLAWLGRRPLSYYMLHQPVLIGLLTAWLAVRPAG
ncbi:MAG: hypothetical protein RL722_1126, partial [Pseudomonadota bacterium]